MKIKEILVVDETLKADIDFHLYEISEYLMLKLYKLIWNKSSLSILNLELENWLEVLRRHEYTKILEIPEILIDNQIWDDAAKQMKELKNSRTPSEKLETIVKTITTISTAYSLLSESGDDVTADDIL